MKIKSQWRRRDYLLPGAVPHAAPRTADTDTTASKSQGKFAF